MNWRELAVTSPYRTAVAVDETLRHGDVREAAMGVQELVDALARSDKRALKSQLIRLMAHVIKWRSQAVRRSRSRRATIRNARREIAEIQEDTPTLNRPVLESMWDSCFEAAKEEAEGDMNQPSAIESLTWEEVYEHEYEVEPRVTKARKKPKGKRMTKKEKS